MHGVANATMESGVMLMGEELGRKTSLLDHGLIKFLIFFFDGGWGIYQMEWVCSAFGSRMDQKQRDRCFLLEGSRWLFPGILLCAGSTQVEK